MKKAAVLFLCYALVFAPFVTAAAGGGPKPQNNITHPVNFSGIGDIKVSDPLSPATTALTSDTNPSVYGQSVTFTATVSPVAPGTGTPTGTVTFVDNGADITGCSAQTLNASGQATCSTSTLALGTHMNISAVYSGDGNFGGSASSAYSQIVTPTILYAIPGGVASGVCDSWTNACDLQYALTMAPSGVEIWVAAGTYKPTDGTDRSATFQLKNGVAVYGGFIGIATETERLQRDFSTNVTILSGDIGAIGDNSDNSYNVVTGSGTDNTAILDGLTITGGNADGSAGGGMYNVGGSPTLTNVTFSSNSASAFGGGMFNYSSSNPTLTNVTFSSNSASYYGGGMFNYFSSNPTLTNVTFSSNSAPFGGGMFNYSSSNPTLTNVTFSSNSASTFGGGMFNEASNPTLTNVTFSSNSASYYGGGMYNRSSSSPSLTNCILWGNTNEQIYDDGSSSVVNYSIVQGGCPATGTCTNVLDTDPLFGTLGSYGGYTQTIPLLPGSPAIDAASSSCPATDQRGLTRSSPKCDLGAYEYVPADQAITVSTPAPATVVYNSTFDVAATASSGLDVAITTTGPCSVSAGGTGSATIQMTSSTGTCTLHYNQEGNSNYNAAPEVLEYTTAQKAEQSTLTLNAGTPLTYGSTETLSTTGGSGTGAVTYQLLSGNCSLVGDQLTANSGMGSCSVQATKAGDANYNEAIASATVALQRAAQTITFDALPVKYVGDADFNPGATASSGLAVSYSSSDPSVATIAGGLIHITGAGTTTITASQSGDSNYNPAADVQQTLYVYAVPGNALNFDGVDDYVSIPRAIQDDFTIEFWVQTTQTAGTGQWYKGNGLVDGEVGGATNDFGTALIGDKFGFGVGNPDTTITSTTTINDGKWHHVAATRTRATGEMQVYVDGNLETTGIGSTQSLNTPPGLTIGSLQTRLNFFEGSIDELRIWDIARTQAEIQDNMSVVLDPGSEPNLVAYYRFDQGLAEGDNAGETTLYDSISESNDGTLHNFALNNTASNWVESGAFLPLLETASVIAITDKGARSGGAVFPNDLSITDRGVCWSTNPYPTTLDSCTHDGTGEGTFTSAITNLVQNMSYHVRAFAVNAQGTAYGDDLSFTTRNSDGPDLTGRWISLTSSSHQYTDIHGELLVMNIGNRNAGRFLISFYLSADGKTLGKLIGTEKAGDLRVGKTKRVHISYHSRTPLASLPWKHIIAVIDSLNQFSETNENNNWIVTSIP